MKVSIVLQVLGCVETVCGDEEGFESQGGHGAKGSANEIASKIFQCLGSLCSDNSDQERCQTASIGTGKSKQIKVQL